MEAGQRKNGIPAEMFNHPSGSVQKKKKTTLCPHGTIYEQSVGSYLKLRCFNSTVFGL